MTAFQTLKPSTLSRNEFVAAFADIYEHSPWVAEKAFDLGQDPSIDEIENLHQRMSDILLSADHASQLALINAHPDLAGKAAVQGQLTEASTNEQAGAGIHQCTAEEFSRFPSWLSGHCSIAGTRAHQTPFSYVDPPPVGRALARLPDAHV